MKKFWLVVDILAVNVWCILQKEGEKKGKRMTLFEWLKIDS